MASSGCDRRGTSFAADVDAAIERVVAHFEDNDIAVRLDVLRSLSAHAQLAFEAERVRERLQQHPATKDLVHRVTTQSPVFEQLAKLLRVDECSCDYDAQWNVAMKTTVRWTLPVGSSASSGGKKKRKKSGSAGADGSSSSAAVAAVVMQYLFTRDVSEDGESQVQFTVSVSMGDAAEPKEFVHFQMASEASYPRSFYEENRNEEESDDEEMEEEEESEADGAKSSAKDAVHKSSDKEESDGEEGEEGAGEEGESYGEAILAFRFDDKVLDAIMMWLLRHDEKHAGEIDPADVIGFFLALPVYEDEWLVDERICEILFSAGMEEMEVDEEEEAGDEADGSEADEGDEEEEEDA